MWVSAMRVSEYVHWRVAFVYRPNLQCHNDIRKSLLIQPVQPSHWNNQWKTQRQRINLPKDPDCTVELKSSPMQETFSNTTLVAELSRRTFQSHHRRAEKENKARSLS